MLFEVVVDCSDRHDTRILVWGKLLDAIGFLVPIHDTSHKGRDERASDLGAGNCLRNGEDERSIAGNSIFFQHLRSLDTLPRGGDFDKDAFLAHAHLLVHFDDIACLLNGGIGVEAKSRVDFRRNVAGNDLGNLGTEAHRELVHGHGEISLAVGHGLVDDVRVFCHHGRLVDEAGVCGGILRREFLDRVEVSRVGDDGGELLQFLYLRSRLHRHDGCFATEMFAVFVIGIGRRG
mmetsp:Transcript_266/g.624  ORF Transcript_266/g.624 Transcript_266/m.624 type:complete len:234 (+) Transcript_266:514-1215(+)